MKKRTVVTILILGILAAALLAGCGEKPHETDVKTEFLNELFTFNKDDRYVIYQQEEKKAMDEALKDLPDGYMGYVAGDDTFVRNYYAALAAFADEDTIDTLMKNATMQFFDKQAQMIGATGTPVNVTFEEGSTSDGKTYYEFELTFKLTVGETEQDVVAKGQLATAKIDGATKICAFKITNMKELMTALMPTA